MIHQTVVESVAAKGLCIGCGTCAAVCPRANLSIKWNDLGGYSVTRGSESCSDSCDLCVRVCPFGDHGRNESLIAGQIFSGEGSAESGGDMGFSRSVWAGFRNQDELRERGASGGLTTWLLSAALRNGAVDRVLCVKRNCSPNPLFEYTACSLPDGVESCSRSAYYPVEWSRVLRNVLSTEGRTALVCLPCFAKSVRLAAELMPGLRSKIALVVGLVCGHSASSFFAEFACSLAFGRKTVPEQVTFRTKNRSLPASELGTECRLSADPDGAKTVYWSEGLGEAWSQQWFTPRPCLYCDDVFAETADVVFMDAWLPEYESDYRGTNLVVVRSQMANEILEDGARSGEITLIPETAERVVASQRAVARNKTEGLAHRLWMGKRDSVDVPRKRVEPKQAAAEDAEVWEIQAEASSVGPVLWRESRTLEEFLERMRPYAYRRVDGVRSTTLAGRLRSAVGKWLRR